MDDAPHSAKRATLANVLAAALLAACCGFSVGALLAALVPGERNFWAGLLLAPIWLCVELYLESVVVAFGERSTKARVASVLAVLGGFYFAAFAIGGTAA